MEHQSWKVIEQFNFDFNLNSKHKRTERGQTVDKIVYSLALFW